MGQKACDFAIELKKLIKKYVLEEHLSIAEVIGNMESEKIAIFSDVDKLAKELRKRGITDIDDI